jgi:hypothetical protein
MIRGFLGPNGLEVDLPRESIGQGISGDRFVKAPEEILGAEHLWESSQTFWAKGRMILPRHSWRHMSELSHAYHNKEGMGGS